MMMYLGEEEACDLGRRRDVEMQIGKEERRRREERSTRGSDRRDQGENRTEKKVRKRKKKKKKRNGIDTKSSGTGERVFLKVRVYV